MRLVVRVRGLYAIDHHYDITIDFFLKYTVQITHY